MICKVTRIDDKRQLVKAICREMQKNLQRGAFNKGTTFNELNSLPNTDAVIARADELGVTVEVHEVVANLDSQRNVAYQEIDNAANDCDARYTTVGGQMPAIYRGKLAHCAAWLANGSPEDVSVPGYGYIRAEMKRLVELGQPATAADAVAAMQGVGLMWEDTLAEKREEFRGVGKAKVLNATDAAAIRTITALTVASLKAL